MSGGSIWDRFTVDPRHEANARLRASDHDRDVVNDLLGTAYAEGRLTPDELDERSDQVAKSKTLGELPAIIDDLVLRSDLVPTRPRDLRAEAEHRYRQQRQNAFFGFLTPTLICWAIWFFTGADALPWPLLVMAASGAKFLQVALTREDTILSIQRDLEKNERKRLEARKAKQIEQHPADEGHPPED
jgi:hypothetical protein